MMNLVRFALLSAFIFTSIFAVPAQEQKALTNSDVIEMLKGGLSAEIVVAKIKASVCTFDTSPASLQQLKAGGVPESVIIAMVQAPTSKSKATEEISVAPSSSPKEVSPSEVTLEYGTVADLKGKKRVYLFSNDDYARDIIYGEMDKCDCFDFVGKPEKADFVVAYGGGGTVTGLSPKIFGYGYAFDGSNVGEFVVLARSEESTPQNPRLRILFKRKKEQNYSGGITFNRHPAFNSIREFLTAYRRVNSLK